MMVPLAATTLAGQEDARKTDFFPHDLYHTDLDFSEIEYRHIEAEPILKEIENIRELNTKAAALLLKTYTAGYDAMEWDLTSVEEALNSGKLTEEDAERIRTDIYRVKNEELGNLYLEMLAVRREIAKTEGYDSYPEYSYKKTHLCDYTPDEAARLYADTKEYIAPLFAKVEEIYSKNEAENREFFNHDFAGDGDDLLNLMEPYMGRISSEVQESFH